MTDLNSVPSAFTRVNLVFGVATCIVVVIAHAGAYMTHEYSHSFVAWALGWMRDPLALDYGHPMLYNILFLGDIGDNVQYDPIFAGGHGVLASVIALSGTVIGNGLLYFILYFIATMDAVASNRALLSAVYWIGVMCAGNVWGYVPIRAITSHADIAIAAKGFGVPTWVQFPFLIVPALYVVYHFFCRMVPRCLWLISAGSKINMALVIALTAYWFFAFFGGDGTDGSYGLVSQLLAITSKYFLFPLAVMWLTSREVITREQTLGIS
jgi:hypothetical protein